jgi:hypothetical protein
MLHRLVSNRGQVPEIFVVAGVTDLGEEHATAGLGLLSGDGRCHEGFANSALSGHENDALAIPGRAPVSRWNFHFLVLLVGLQIRPLSPNIAGSFYALPNCPEVP